jgi:hypothetical protein
LACEEFSPRLQLVDGAFVAIHFGGLVTNNNEETTMVVSKIKIF